MAVKVSVIIATHNHAHFLPECLASVKRQTYQDYEVIVINNGSTDNTEEVIKERAWEKLRYFYQEDTGSVAGPRNTGIRLAKGKFVAFLDSDDLWYKHKLEKVMSVFEYHPEIDIISHDVLMRIYGKVGPVAKVGPKGENMFKQLLSKNCLAGSGTVVKKQVMDDIGGFDESSCFVHAEDYETWLRIAYKDYNFYFINECLGENRVHKSNLSHDFVVVISNEINVIDKHFGLLRNKNILDYYLWRRRKANLLITMAYRLHMNKYPYQNIILSILRSICCDPIIILILIRNGVIRMIKRVKGGK